MTACEPAVARSSQDDLTTNGPDQRRASQQSRDSRSDTGWPKVSARHHVTSVRCASELTPLAADAAVMRLPLQPTRQRRQGHLCEIIEWQRAASLFVEWGGAVMCEALQLITSASQGTASRNVERGRSRRFRHRLAGYSNASERSMANAALTESRATRNVSSS